ncbi:hypothetical protein W97_04248 [Coniosporium apollinis CBS 100218]|uniref:Protein farnesyltransferase/geranylgeranyltransferase type-1 subunit alpha n=1 Tax=Coniosporium apollinis (strain CBS 100218) TaxID=1168221 RepID=R7YT50_CONA1|nr:uncharacterized protein W97_04248 [Coniosporium apollinis CBS 100218]EON65013.1 hypothetical protein W97_04248 [Coniosporium apollinis CBS 100218]
MPKYAEDPAWSDVEPLPQNDGGPNPLAAIAYTEEYSEAMSYLRAVMASNDMSERVLDLTEDIINMNPAHYTVWLYRAKVLFNLNYDLRKEIDWLNDTALKHQKNYQIWQHRQTIINRLGSADGETAFIAKMFSKDPKNYHVWSYRQWLVRRFELWDEGEIEAVEGMIKEDVRNNSAWNHRWFLVFGRDSSAHKEQDVIERELEYAKKAIVLAPQNQSPWNYLRGVLRYAELPVSHVRDFALGFAPADSPDDVRSSYALDLLADVYEEQHQKEEAIKALDLLATKYDPIRARYWEYKKNLLEQPTAAA